MGVALVLLLGAVLVLRIREGQWLLATAQLTLGLVVVACAAPEVLMRGADPPRFLWLYRDAQREPTMELEHRSGRRRRVRAAAATLVWSRCVLLVLDGRGGPPTRLLLGPGNVPASQLAALRREWLRRPAGLAGPLA